MHLIKANRHAAHIFPISVHESDIVCLSKYRGHCCNEFSAIYCSLDICIFGISSVEFLGKIHFGFAVVCKFDPVNILYVFKLKEFFRDFHNLPNCSLEHRVLPRVSSGCLCDPLGLLIAAKHIIRSRASCNFLNRNSRKVNEAIIVANRAVDAFRPNLDRDHISNIRHIIHLNLRLLRKCSVVYLGLNRIGHIRARSILHKIRRFCIILAPIRLNASSGASARACRLVDGRNKVSLHPPARLSCA